MLHFSWLLTALSSQVWEKWEGLNSYVTFHVTLLKDLYSTHLTEYQILDMATVFILAVTEFKPNVYHSFG